MEAGEIGSLDQQSIMQSMPDTFCRYGSPRRSGHRGDEHTKDRPKIPKEFMRELS